jgi:hypothetical protein
VFADNSPSQVFSLAVDDWFDGAATGIRTKLGSYSAISETTHNLRNRVFSEIVGCNQISCEKPGFSPPPTISETGFFPKLWAVIKYPAKNPVSRHPPGFVPVAARWVIERSNAWVERCKSLVKNFDRTLARSNAKLKLCFIRLMLKRLATD